MGELSMTFDMTEFLGKAGSMTVQLKVATDKALSAIADEILRLSQREVPFVSGELMNSGTTQKISDAEYVVGYNKVYAAYMHEGHWFDGSHHISQYSNNRKGKYLEDPIKINREILRIYFAGRLNEALRFI